MKKKKVNLIILANSTRDRARCIAGICPETGMWMRPIPKKKGEHAIRKSPTIEGIRLLDIVQIPFSGRKPRPPVKYQIENEYIESYRWKKVGRATIKQIKEYVDNVGELFHSDSVFVFPNKLEALAPAEWKSLRLIKVKTKFTRDLFDKDGWRANFIDDEGNELSLKVTDPVATDELNCKKKYDGICLLTISLAEPWAKNVNVKKRCYKLVAGVIKIRKSKKRK